MIVSSDFCNASTGSPNIYELGWLVANEEVFGPVLSVIKWSDEEAMLEQVYRVEYGLTAAIFTKQGTSCSGTRAVRLYLGQ